MELVGLQDKPLLRVGVECPYEANQTSAYLRLLYNEATRSISSVPWMGC